MVYCELFWGFKVLVEMGLGWIMGLKLKMGFWVGWEKKNDVFGCNYLVLALVSDISVGVLTTSQYFTRLMSS